MITWITEKIIPLIIPFNIYIAIFQLFYSPPVNENDHELFRKDSVEEISLLENSPLSPYKVESNQKISVNSSNESFKHKDYTADLYLFIRTYYLPNNTFLEYDQNIQDYISGYILSTNNIDFHSPPFQFV